MQVSMKTINAAVAYVWKIITSTQNSLLKMFVEAFKTMITASVFKCYSTTEEQRTICL